MADQQEKAKEVKQRFEQKWLAIEEVVAVGLGITDNREIGIIISVTDHPEKIKKQLPSQVEGIPVEIQKTGEIKAQ